MFTLRYVLIATLVVFSVSAVSAQKFLSKPYTSWSTEEAQKIINDSGWARTYISTDGNAQADAQSASRTQRDTVNSGGGRPGSTARTLGTLPLVARLHSSLILRQAMVRLQQINIKYDKMSDSDKAKFDASRKGYLECPICKDFYVVTLTKYTDSSGETVGDGIFQSVTLDDIKGKVALVNDKGERRMLFQFNPAKSAGDAAVLYFPRKDENGNPLITADSKEVELVFSGEFVDWNKRYAGQYPRKFEFDVSKMTVDGNVAF